jgi:hypothetical protein
MEMSLTYDNFRNVAKWCVEGRRTTRLKKTEGEKPLSREISRHATTIKRIVEAKIAFQVRTLVIADSLSNKTGSRRIVGKIFGIVDKFK